MHRILLVLELVAVTVSCASRPSVPRALIPTETSGLQWITIVAKGME